MSASPRSTRGLASRPPRTGGLPPIGLAPGASRLKLENDALMDRLGRIMHAMSGATQELIALRREVRRLGAENTSLRAELRRLRGRPGQGASADDGRARATGDARQP